jgi:AcrR family transcriptional regulator
MTPELIAQAQRMYDSRQFTMAEIAASCSVTPVTVYRHVSTSSLRAARSISETV